MKRPIPPGPRATAAAIAGAALVAVLLGNRLPASAIVDTAATVQPVAPQQSLASSAAASATTETQTGTPELVGQPSVNRYLSAVYRHVGDKAEDNTCVSAGVWAWAKESGLKYPMRRYSTSEILTLTGERVGGTKDTRYNVTGISAAAKQGIDGYRWIPISEAEPGDWPVWKEYEHISVLIDKPGGLLRTIGTSESAGIITYQPRPDLLPLSNYEGAIRPPYGPSSGPLPVPPPVPVGGYTPAPRVTQPRPPGTTGAVRGVVALKSED